MTTVSPTLAVNALQTTRDALAAQMEHAPAFLSTADVHKLVSATIDKPTAGNREDEARKVILPVRQALADAGVPDDQHHALILEAIDGQNQRRTLLGQRVTLGSLMREGVPEPTFLPSGTLGERLFYDESVWIISGHPKSGKSWAMLTTALDCATDGRPVVYLDFENRRKRFTSRLLALGADPDVVDEHLHYVELPQGLTLDTLATDLREVAERLPGAFVVVDSLRGLMARLSGSGRVLDANSAQDVEAVCDPLNLAASLGLTVGVIDHDKKNGKEGDAYSTSGSQAKEAAVDCVYYWTQVDPFSQTERGIVKIKTKRDRDGALDFERHWHVGGQGNGALTFERADAHEVGRLGEISDRVRTVLVENSAVAHKLSDVEAKVKGRREDIRAALEALAKSDEHVHEDKGDRADRKVWTFDESRTSAVVETGPGLAL